MSKPDQPRMLTAVERKILVVLQNPKYFVATNEEKIKAAACSRGSFYTTIKDPWFEKQLYNAWKDYTKDLIGPILAAAVALALEPTRDGFQDRKMLLEMSGIYAPVQKHANADGSNLPAAPAAVICYMPTPLEPPVDGE